MRSPLFQVVVAVVVAVVTAPVGAQVDVAAPESLFDGKSMAGWDGAVGVWSVREGCLVGSTVGRPIERNTFLVWAGGELADFELTLQARLEGDNNSGVQYRSRRTGEGFGVAGYQCDLHAEPSYVGMLYEEGGRGIVATFGQQVACGADGKGRLVRQHGEPKVVDLSAWHALRIVARGRTVQHFVDGALAVEVTDESAAAPRRGIVALQVHSGPPMTVWFKDLVLRRLPTEEVAAVPAEATVDGQAPHWIWDSSPQDGEEVFFRRAFALAASPKAARLAITCDNHCRVYVNGERMAQSDGWETPRFLDVRKLLREGANVLAVHGWNDSGPGGLCAQLRWTLPDGTQDAVVTDGQWRCSGDDPDGWDQGGFDDAGWPAATLLAPLGAGPWGRELARDAFANEPDLGPQPPVGTDELQVPQYFAVERLLRVPRSQGSWVCLAVDPRGRLYASDQTRGLYRIVPAGVGNAPSTSLEPVEVDLDGCQGLCWAFGSLYAVANGRRSGLYRLRDTDGDDRLDRAELLAALDGDGEHGPHAVERSPDGKGLLVLCGNHTRPPVLARSRVPRNWGEDQLLPRFPDPNGHAVGVMAPGGFLCRTDPDGVEWELLTCGFRNAYDLAVQPVTGEIFVFDADMEWDMGLPWYRPTRVLHCVSGADFGWRHGSGKWPADYPDTLPSVCDVGPGSPTGMVFAHGARMGDRMYRLLIADWTFGTVHELLPRDRGASWGGQPAEFAVGAPFPVTDMVVGEDGRLYVATGGRGLPTSLYRLEYRHRATTPEHVFRPPLRDLTALAVKSVREELERFHGVADPAAVGAAWPHLGDVDPFVRHAARIALEWQPVDSWRQRALAEAVQPPWPALTVLLALARQGAAADLASLLEALGRFDFGALEPLQKIAWLRVHALALIRLGPPDAAARQAAAARLLPLFPSGDERADAELCALLAALDAPGLLDVAVPLLAELRPAAPPPWTEIVRRNRGYGSVIEAMLASMPPAPQIALANALRTVAHGWTLEQRTTLFTFLAAARQRKGGASYNGYLKAIVEAAWQTCSAAEQQQLAEVAGQAKADPAPFVALPPKGPGRDWQLADAIALAARGLRDRDFAAGRNLFHASSCAACHRFTGEGGSVGPDLTSLGNKFGAADVLEAILEPSKVVSDQYVGSVLTRKDGTTLFGRVARHAAAGADVYSVVTATADAKVIEVPAAEVAGVQPSRLSTMPADLVDRLSDAELLDLLAFLLSRGDPGAPMFRLPEPARR